MTNNTLNVENMGNRFIIDRMARALGDFMQARTNGYSETDDVAPNS